MIINAAIVAWAIAQVMKVFSYRIMVGKWNFRRALGSGGMPSSHTAFLVAATYTIMEKCGAASPEFAISLCITLVVMTDAFGVRRAAGEHARVLNILLDDMERQQVINKSLKEFLGHTPFEVFAGLIIGILVGVIM